MGTYRVIKGYIGRIGVWGFRGFRVLGFRVVRRGGWKP